jgi:hypothetical protein
MVNYDARAAGACDGTTDYLGKRTNMRGLLIGAVLLAVMAANAAARPDDPEAAEPLITDRPDITESSRVVAPATLQIETSVLWRRFSIDAIESEIVSTPTLFRFGVGRSIELRLATAYSALSEDTPAAQTDKTSGAAPFVLGAKYHLKSEGPSIGIIAFAELPSGSSAFKTRYVTAAALVAADGQLSERFSLGANAGLTALDGEGKARWAGALSTALGLSLSERAAGFGEIAVGGIGLGSQEVFVVADAGIVFLLSPNVQLDAAFGGGLTDQSDPDLFATVGFSCRISLSS